MGKGQGHQDLLSRSLRRASANRYMKKKGQPAQRPNACGKKFHAAVVGGRAAQATEQRRARHTAMMAVKKEFFG